MLSTVTGRAPRKTADMYIITDGWDLVMEQVDPTGCRAGNKFTSRPNLTYNQNKSIARVLKISPHFSRGGDRPHRPPINPPLTPNTICSVQQFYFLQSHIHQYDNNIRYHA